MLKKRKRSETEDASSALQLDLGALLGGAAMMGKNRRSMFQLGGSDTIYTHKNHVFFNDEVTEETMSMLCRELRMAEENVLGLCHDYGLEEDVIPLVLHLSTPGGNLHAVFMAIDTLEALRIPVYTVVHGYVASAGTLLSVCGKRRFITRNSSMLIHQLRSGVWGKMSEIEDDYENLKKMTKQIIRHYVKYTNMDKKELKEILKHDLDWTPEECLARGLVDEIGTPDTRGLHQ